MFAVGGGGGERPLRRTQTEGGDTVRTGGQRGALADLVGAQGAGRPSESFFLLWLQHALVSHVRQRAGVTAWKKNNFDVNYGVSQGTMYPV